jgi:hypothetical protein
VSTGGTQGTGRPPMRFRATNKKWSMALGGMVVVFVVLAGYDLIFGGALGGGPAAAPKATASRTAPVRTTAPPSAVTPVTPVTPSSSAGSPTASPARELTVASVAAFGPEGTSDGDNPGLASRVVDGGGAWYSSWYVTPEFGNLQSGTGILLDMGQAVTVSSVRLVLGDAVGADVQVRVGDTAVLGDMSTAASVLGVGGTVRLPLSAPASARYVLIWFTRLPPNSQGTYQVSVYNATVDGRI